MQESFRLPEVRLTMAIRIVTDSVADLPPAIASANDVSVVPLYVMIGSESFRDGIDIDADDFYSRLVKNSKLPTTSQPSVFDFRKAYELLLDEGHHVVSIHVSSKLSGTITSATQAKTSLGNPHQIEIVDSQLAGGALGLLALDASRWAKEADDHVEMAQRARRAIAANSGYVVVDTLRFLQMGGRIGKAQALVAGMLSFKPIVCIRDGEVHPVERPRTRRRAVARLTSIVRDLAPIQTLHLSYTTGRDGAMAIREELSSLVPPGQIIESRLGPVLGTHLGPNALSVALTRSLPTPA